MTSEFEKLKMHLRAKPEKKKPAAGLSTGLTLLNLALTGDPDYGLLGGHYYLLVGDSQAGKSWLLKQLMCEAAISSKFKKHRLIDDNPERGTLMDLARYFPPLVGRLEQPSEHGHSRTLEEFYDNVGFAADKGKPFFYGLDSEDALPPEEEVKKAKDGRAAAKKGKPKDEAGSYGTARAKKNSTALRLAHNALEATGSILAIIKQTRDNIGFGAQFSPKTRSGGRALTFYATCELWFSVRKQLKTDYKGNAYGQGSVLQITVKKNRISGQNWPVLVPFYPSVGFDEVGSMCDFLIAHKHWKGSDKKIDAHDLGILAAPEDIPHLIEDADTVDVLREITVEVWRKVEAAVRVERKARYV